jgi:Flp pilus assembly pilin Flp
MKRLRKIIKNERGQGMLEYVLLIFIIVGLVVIFKKNIVTIFTSANESISSKTSSVFSDSQ